MSTVRIKLVRSLIKIPKTQKLTAKALKLNKMNRVVEHEATPQIMGMVNKLRHLLEVDQA